MSEKKTVLYVDDYADNRRLLQRILESDGFVVLQACNGGEALKLLETQKPDLALIDLHLPDTTGYELSARIRELPGCLELPIISVTAGDFEDKRINPSANDGFFQKPFQLDALLQDIRLRLGLTLT